MVLQPQGIVEDLPSHTNRSRNGIKSKMKLMAVAHSEKDSDQGAQSCISAMNLHNLRHKRRNIVRAQLLLMIW
jgi:hypothetical protein